MNVKAAIDPVTLAGFVTALRILLIRSCVAMKTPSGELSGMDERLDVAEVDAAGTPSRDAILLSCHGYLSFSADASQYSPQN